MPALHFRSICGALVLLSISCAMPSTNRKPRGAPVLVIAHRGLSGLAPEHTWEAYDRAIEVGADYIEQDLHMSADGALVILHDDSLERTARGSEADCSGRAREKTLIQLRSCDFGSWFGAAFRGQSIITLDELLSKYGRTTRYYIETKHPDEMPGMEEKLVAELRRFGFLDESQSRAPASVKSAVPGQTIARGGAEAEAVDKMAPIVIQSFSRDSLEKMRALAPALPRIQLVERGDFAGQIESGLKEIASYAIGVAPNHLDVDAAFVAAAHRHGLWVHPWTVNDPAEMERLIELGVDGLFTDRADRLIPLKVTY
jgi:glycerophosphoryl diester phosphodiesterase